MKPSRKNIIGMLHIQALPGTPGNIMNMKQIIEHTLREADIYTTAGIKTLMIENMHDTPYLNRNVGPEITACMSVLAYELCRKFDIDLGVQILAGANKDAMAVALSSGAKFIRAEGFVYSHIADEGFMDSCAGELLRYRKTIGAEHVKIVTDIKKKHSSHAITSDVSIVETAKAAEFFKADGVIITGESTGLTANVSELIAVKQNCNIPVLIGSGITAENLPTYLKHADSLIIGSSFKEGGIWYNEISVPRVNEVVKAYNLFVEKNCSR